MAPRQYILAILLLQLAVPADAQLYVGLKGAYTLSFSRPQEIKYDDAQDFLTYKINFIEQDVAPSIHAFAYYRNELIYLQGELGFRSIKTRFLSTNFLSLDNLTPVENVKKTNYVLVPISAGLRIANFKLGVGPVFSFIVSENAIFRDIENFEERRSKIETGFAFNFGMALYRLHIDLSYEVKFNSVGDYLYYRQDSKGFDNAVQYMSLGLGFLF